VVAYRNAEGEIKKVTHLEPGFKEVFFKTLLLVPFRKFDTSGRVPHLVRLDE